MRLNVLPLSTCSPSHLSIRPRRAGPQQQRPGLVRCLPLTQPSSRQACGTGLRAAARSVPAPRANRYRRERRSALSRTVRSTGISRPVLKCVIPIFLELVVSPM